MTTHLAPLRPAGDHHARPAGFLGKWPPVCDRCGHRHAPSERCAGHIWRDECPYNAGSDCPGGSRD